MNNIIKKSLAFVFAVLMIFSAFNVAENYSPLTAYAASSISIKKTPALKASKVKAKSVKLSWSKVKKATKYEIYRSTDKKNWKLVKTTDKTSVTIKKLKTGKTYYFKVRALTKKKTGVFSKVKKVTPKPYKVKGINATFKNSKKVTLTWKKSKGATHYQIVYSTDSKFKENKKVKTVKADKLSYTLKKLKANTSYFVKVRAINKNYKKTAKGKYSTKLELVTETKTIYTYKKTKVYATGNVNIRKAPSTSAAIVGGLKVNQSITRTAVGDNGWSKVSLNGTTAYVMSAYLTTKKPVVSTTGATTTKKAEETTKKQETTTTTKPVETTKSNEKKTGEYQVVNGKKYPVYVDDTGYKYIYNEYGLKRGYDPNFVDTTGKYNGCDICGSTECRRTLNGYYCKICKKNIPAATCHPKSHLIASH